MKLRKFSNILWTLAPYLNWPIISLNHIGHKNPICSNQTQYSQHGCYGKGNICDVLTQCLFPFHTHRQNRRYVSSSDDTEEEAENFTLPPPIQPLVPLTTPLTSNINPQSQRQNFPDAVVSPISARHSTGSTQSLAGSSRNISPMSTPDLIVNGV